MKLNVNKDLLLKHKFWIFLGVGLPIILAAMFMVLVPVADSIANQRKEVEKTLNDAKKPSGMFIPQEKIDEIKRKVEEAKTKEYGVWGKAYADQAAGDSLFWPVEFEQTYPVHTGKFLRALKYIDAGANPPEDEHNTSGKIVAKDNLSISVQTKAGKTEKFYRVNALDMKLDDFFFQIQVGKEAAITYQTGRYFNDRLHDAEQAQYSKLYHTQIRPILDIVEPVNEEGEGVVQLRDWLVPKKLKELPHERGGQAVKFIRYVPSWNVNADISEEAWMAQEDLWVQKEIYRLIRTANNYVADMKLVGKPAHGKGQAAAFRNPYYELRLELVSDNKAKVTIKNLRNRRQKLEVNFRVRFNENTKLPEDRIHIEGEPLDPEGTVDKNRKPTDLLTKEIDLGAGPPRTGIYACSQILTWETAAVRRIDHIAIGSMAVEDMAVNNRVFPDGTRPLVLKKEEEIAAGGQPGEAGPPRNPFGPPPGQAGLINVMLTANGLIKDRYLDVTDQSRRIPIGIAVIVDQAHIDRVLTAFDNSRFRFLLNQVLLNRYPTTLRPNLPNKDDPTAPGAVPGAAPPPRFGGGEGGGGGLFQPRVPLGPGPGAGGQPGQPAGGGGDEELEGNVELVLYGTMTLYQRFPPRKIPATWEEAAKQP